MEFQGKEIEDLKKETKKEIRKSASLIENKVDYTNDRTYANRQHIANLWREINRLERQTRRNNIRIIGVPESDGENVMEIVEGIISEIGLEDNVEVERAHRDGKVRYRDGVPHPRQILIKLLRYTDKINIMKSSKRALKDKSYRFVEDLTKTDLEEKQRWKQEVGDLYKKEVKLRFVGGMWKSQCWEIGTLLQRKSRTRLPGGTRT